MSDSEDIGEDDRRISRSARGPITHVSLGPGGDRELFRRQRERQQQRRARAAEASRALASEAGATAAMATTTMSTSAHQTSPAGSLGTARSTVAQTVSQSTGLMASQPVVLTPEDVAIQQAALQEAQLQQALGQIKREKEMMIRRRTRMQRRGTDIEEFETMDLTHMNDDVKVVWRALLGVIEMQEHQTTILHDIQQSLAVLAGRAQAAPSPAGPGAWPVPYPPFSVPPVTGVSPFVAPSTVAIVSLGMPLSGGLSAGPSVQVPVQSVVTQVPSQVAISGQSIVSQFVQPQGTQGQQLAQQPVSLGLQPGLVQGPGQSQWVPKTAIAAPKPFTGDKRGKDLDTWLRAVPVYVRCKLTLPHEEVLVAASYLEGSAARWLSGLVQLQGHGHDFRSWAASHKLEDFLKMVGERWHDPQEAQKAIDASLTLHTRQYKSVREATDVVERLICVSGVRYDPRVLLTSYLRCLSQPLRNQLAKEANMNMHNFPSFSKVALDLEPKIGHGHNLVTDGKKKTLLIGKPRAALCSYSLYEFVVMPFGLCNAPDTFHHAMNWIFHDYLDKFVIVYLNDILIFSKTVEEHVAHLDKVLSLLRQHKLKINGEKCEFGRTQVLYFGHEISAEGLKLDDAKMGSIRDWPRPQFVTEMRSFLGMTGYYRTFVKNYSVVAAPLTDLTRLDTWWEGTDECEAAFRHLKHALTHYEVLKLPDPDKPFIVTTDASQYGIGAVLAQQEGSKLRPVEYMSKKMPFQKLAKSTYEKKLYAVFEALTHWRHDLLGRPGESLSMDFVDTLVTSKSGMRQIFVIVDRFSKYVRLIAMPKTAKTEYVIRLFKENEVRDFGLPKSIVSDRDVRFTNVERSIHSALSEEIGESLQLSEMLQCKLDNMEVMEEEDVEEGPEVNRRRMWVEDPICREGDEQPIGMGQSGCGIERRSGPLAHPTNGERLLVAFWGAWWNSTRICFGRRALVLGGDGIAAGRKGVACGEEKVGTVDESMHLQIMEEEVIFVVTELPQLKVAGVDRVPVELYKELEQLMVAHLTAIFILAFAEKPIPQSFVDAVAILLYKKRECGNVWNRRSISILNVLYKILAKLGTPAAAPTKVMKMAATIASYKDDLISLNNGFAFDLFYILFDHQLLIEGLVQPFIFFINYIHMSLQNLGRPREEGRNEERRERCDGKIDARRRWERDHGVMEERVWTSLGSASHTKVLVERRSIVGGRKGSLPSFLHAPTDDRFEFM
ncbi:hypothetical protein CBR_g45505 [Chara braunii]|uniref:Integrase catalytic domain-containing protein n=1 Tax=Chara braunii TaxID=69332 RepID=A0A388LYQ1_CHABU|nr:hypothetical protein CBR_g45505 [Chara braunii]|eukprot:GBG87447.1 hypothetical protein CBR_g45505 [Chara braunii]